MIVKSALPSSAPKEESERDSYLLFFRIRYVVRCCKLSRVCFQICDFSEVVMPLKMYVLQICHLSEVEGYCRLPRVPKGSPRMSNY